MTLLNAVTPQVFEVYIGGFFGPSYKISLKGSELQYTNRTHSADNAIIAPSPEAWERFWASMDLIHAWVWQNNYDDPDILDGTQWKIKIHVGSKHLVSSGSNAYPPKGASNVSRDFRAFCKAVSVLLDGRIFK